MAYISIDETKKHLEDEMKWAEEQLAIEGVTVKCDVQNTLNETTEGDESVFLFGAVAISTQGVDENEILFISLDTELIYDNISDAPVVNKEALYEATEEFRARLSEIKNRLISADDKTEVIKAINSEIDQQLQDEYQAMLDKLNASTKSNLKFALIASAVLLVIALACIVINAII